MWSTTMPKLKTHRGLAKRIKVTKSGKIRRMQAFHRHLMTGKGGARRRRGKRSVIMVGAEAKRLARLLGLR
jgi:large subunit ribosomal protein L35